jgi:wobble nucleotide-excising tRNase
MITKIEKISDFGIFKKYDWDSIEGIKPLKEKNIFYGWNYSGKTTLSRIFSSLRDKTIHPKYNGGDFKIVLDNNKEFTNRSQEQ